MSLSPTLDDEVLSCGGTIAQHVADGDDVTVMFFTDGVSGRYVYTAEDVKKRRAMADAAQKVLGYHAMKSLGFKDQRLDTYPQLELNRSIEKEVAEFKPDIVLTHWDQDNNLDHRLVSQECQVACRSVGKIFMGKPVGNWSQKSFAMAFAKNKYSGVGEVDVSDCLDVKQRALDCYKEELGEVVAEPVELFIKTEWSP